MDKVVTSHRVCTKRIDDFLFKFYAFNEAFHKYGKCTFFTLSVHTSLIL